MTTEKHIQQTRKWIASFVIGLNLCPFAKKPFKENKIHYQVFDLAEEEALVMFLAEQLLYLKNISTEIAETTVVIVPNLLHDFEDYLDFLEVAQELLVSLNLEGIIQIASFHPQYQFAETDADDVSNYTNRSPYPLFHLIREKSIEKAVSVYPNAKQIPQRNIKTLEDLQLDTVKKLSGLE